jgi:hypothetical protein
MDCYCGRDNAAWGGETNDSKRKPQKGQHTGRTGHGENEEDKHLEEDDHGEDGEYCMDIDQRFVWRYVSDTTRRISW